MLRPTERQGIPEETAALGQKLLAPDDPYRIIGECIYDLIDEEIFAEMYNSVGRPAISPVVLALVTVFQYLEDLPDREAAQCVRVRIDWKYALHLPLEDSGFHYSTLCYFRRRLEAHGQERLFFEKVLELLRAQGLVKKRGRQRTDSTHVLGVVKELSRLELIWESLRVVLRAIAQVAPEWYEGHLPAALRTEYTQRKADYRLSDVERKTVFQQVGADASWLVDQIAAHGPEAVQQLAEVAVLQRVLAQQIERVDGQVQKREKPVDEEGEGLIWSPHEPEVRCGKKGHRRWLGYKVHVTETAEDEGMNFMTDVETVPAAEADIQALERIQARLKAQGLTPREQYVDQSYVSGRTLAESEAQGIKLMGYVQENPGGKGCFPQSAFQVDLEKREAICPAGQRATCWTRRRQRDGQWATVIRFGSSCETCALRAQWTNGKGRRSLTIHANHQQLAARRAEMRTPAFREAMKRRAPIEGTISVLVRRTGMRRARYRGLSNVRLQHLFQATAINVIRWVRVLAAQKTSSWRAAVPA